MAYTVMTEGLMTVAETAPFIRQAAKLWTEDDRNAFVDSSLPTPTRATSFRIPAACARSAGGGRGQARRCADHLLYHDD
jgi:hypothetical protein